MHEKKKVQEEWYRLRVFLYLDQDTSTKKEILLLLDVDSDTTVVGSSYKKTLILE